ncbi:MAG: hypothetical protein JEZ10_00130 [Verrucomicrobia bacterium]|nr:hypothetical protein [Verrucomicrobiota bacterium]
MVSFAELASWTSNAWKNSENPTQLVPILGISHDTRTLKPGDVYIAIKGEIHDGHDFVAQAVAKGAAGLIVEEFFPMFGTPQLIVPDTLEALWQMAEGVRREWTGTVIGITGSAGKTTVKELVASVLAQKGGVAKTIGNWNNDIGLPLSMMAADRSADYFVFELGMNHPGEIGRLAGLLKPDWAVITTIGKAHTEFFQPTEPGRDKNFQTLERIAGEKAAILNHASKAILDADSEWFDRLQAGFQGRVVVLTREPFRISQPGAHMVQNARFAATLGLELGLAPEEIQAGLDAFRPAPMRWEESEQGGVVFINDAYNANPLSMRAALSAFAELPCTGRKFVVLGGMRELGADSDVEHRELGRFVDSLKFDGVITIGESGTQIGCEGVVGVEKSTAVKLLREILRAGDRVLLKASRGEKLETILEELKS